MGQFGVSRRRNAPPTTHGSAGRPRGDGRLDPVRWRRPGGGTLLRLAAVAALLATAAAVLWSPNPSGSSCGPAASGPPKPTEARSASPGPLPGGDLTSGSRTATGDGTASPVPEGSVGVPIRLADPTALGLVRPGNRVDLLRVDDQGGSPTAIAGAALVLRVTGADDLAAGGLLLALTPEQARQAVAGPKQGFAVVIRSG